MNTFRNFCLDQNWVFTETPQQTDFGKDGYLDFSRDGHLTGQCIALQIKGGVSFRTESGHIIPAGARQRTLWRDSSVPVFGIVWDPEDGGLYWIDLSTTLRTRGLDAKLEIAKGNRIDQGDVAPFLEAMWTATAPPNIALAFGSDDEEMQDAAVYDCYGLGRLQPSYLVLLRRILFSLKPQVQDHAIYVLNSCSLNMDLLLDPRWMSMEARASVRQHFRWTVDEAIALLERTQDEDGFERGSFSSCIYWLLVGTKPYGNHYVELAELAALRAAAMGRDHAAKWALFLRVYWAGENGLEVLNRLVALEAKLGESDLSRELADYLAEYGSVTI